MPRKLKTYQTSQGFFDLAIAAPSMKAALEAWGTSANLFHSGFAWESHDARVIKAAMAKPGILLKRPVGTTEPFQEHSHLPASLPAIARPAESGRAHRRVPGKSKAKRAPGKTSEVDERAARKAAAAYEKQERRRQKQQQKEEAAAARKRALRRKSEAKAEASFEKAKSEHETIAARIEKERAAIEKRADAENARWEKIRDRLQRAIRKARA